MHDRRGSFGVVAAACLVLAACGSATPPTGGSQARIRLLTGQQYQQVLADIFGADIGYGVTSPLPPLARTDGLLESGAGVIGVTADQLQQVQEAAATVAGRVVDEQHRGFLVPCRPRDASAADADCAARFLGAVGRLWYRRPPEPSHLASLVAAAGRAADEQKDFYAGLGIALEGMLISPRALYIVDTTEPDPGHPGARRLDAYAIASRLSFFLWNSAPDDELLAAAGRGELLTRDGLSRQVDRMLASDRLERGVRAFFDDWLGFNDFDALAKDPVKYPVVTGAALADAREQTLRTIYDHLVTRGADYRDLYTTRRTWMSMNLAAIYGVAAGPGWTAMEFPADSPRAGLLTQVSFLAAHAHPARSSATRRGKALREVFLCQKVPQPPPNVDFSKLNDPDPSLKTARDRLKIHSTNASCAGCHHIMDPMGLGLEHFDGGGAYRETEAGAALDTGGELDGQAFTDARGLGQALHDHPALPGCLVNRVYAYATGGAVGARDRETIDGLTQRFAASHYRYTDLLREIATSPGFVTVREGGKQRRSTAVDLPKLASLLPEKSP